MSCCETWFIAILAKVRYLTLPYATSFHVFQYSYIRSILKLSYIYFQVLKNVVCVSCFSHGAWCSAFIILQDIISFTKRTEDCWLRNSPFLCLLSKHSPYHINEVSDTLALQVFRVDVYLWSCVTASVRNRINIFLQSPVVCLHSFLMIRLRKQSTYFATDYIV
jgi:hypothetical protein